MTNIHKATDNFRVNLRHVLKSSARGMQTQMSDATGIRNPALSALISEGQHVRKATIDHAARIANFLGVTIDTMILIPGDFKKVYIIS